MKQAILFNVCLCILLLFSCASSEKTVSSDNTAVNGQTADGADQGTNIMVDNPTNYNVYFDQDQMVKKHSSENVTLYIESGTMSGGFDIWYELPLSGTVPIFCKGDHLTIRENQKSLTINEPHITENYGTFIVIRNNADSAISFYSGGTVNPSIEQKGSPARGNNLVPTNKREFSPRETAVFNISGNSGPENYTIRERRKNTPFAIPQPLQKNHLYTFEFTGAAVTLTDSRPLHRVGEPGKVHTAADALCPLLFAAPSEENGAINVFAATKSGLFRHTFDSAGKLSEGIKNGDGFEITFTAPAGDGFFVAGYAIEGNYNKPIARIHGADGTIRRLLAPSTRPEYYSAFFNTAAHNEGQWLVAGGAAGNPDHTAYVRLLRDSGSALTADGELGKAEFDAFLKNAKAPDGVICGEVRCAAYDSNGKRWLLSGENIGFHPEYSSNSSYLAIINENGIIQNVDVTFKDRSFYQMISDAKGNYYLAGEEQKGRDTIALVVKYNGDGKELWRHSAASAYSFYQDALLDTRDNQLVLGGTLGAKDSGGSGGTPFIEALDIETGAPLWQQQLNDPDFGKAALVTAIAPAPYYGFALTLSGINNGFAVPFMVARVNARGKL